MMAVDPVYHTNLQVHTTLPNPSYTYLLRILRTHALKVNKRVGG